MSNKSFDVFHDFFRGNQHLLDQGCKNWSKERILYQLAYEHAKDSPISIQADSFFMSSRVDWKWLRLLNKPRKIKYQPQSFSLHFTQGIVKLLIIQETIITLCSKNILRITLFKKRAEYIEIEKTRFFNNIHSKGGNLNSIKLITINENQFISYCPKEFIFWELDSSDYMVINNSYGVYGFNIITSEDNLTTDFAFSNGDSDCLLWSVSKKQCEYLKGEKFLADHYPFFITISSKEIIIRNLKDDTIEKITCDHDNYDVKILNNYLVLLGIDKSIIVRDISSGSILLDNIFTKINQSFHLDRSLWVNDVQLLNDNKILYTTGYWYLTSPSGNSKISVITDNYIINLNNQEFHNVSSSKILFKMNDYLFFIKEEALFFYSISKNSQYRINDINAEDIEELASKVFDAKVIGEKTFLIYNKNYIDIYIIKALKVSLYKSIKLKSNIVRIVKEYDNQYIRNCFVISTELGDIHILYDNLIIKKYEGHNLEITDYRIFNGKLFTKSKDGSFRWFDVLTKESISFPGHIENAKMRWVSEEELLSYHNYTIRYSNFITSETAILQGSTGLIRGLEYPRNSKIFKDFAVAWDTTGFLRFWDLNKIKRNKIIIGEMLRLTDHHESSITFLEEINPMQFLSFSRDGTIRILDVTNNKSTQIFPLSFSNKARPQITSYKIKDNLLYFVSNKANDLSVINLNDYTYNRYSLKNISGRSGIRDIAIFNSKLVYNTFNRNGSNLSVFDLQSRSFTELKLNGILFQGIMSISKSQFITYTNFAPAKDHIGYLTLWDINSNDPIVNILVDDFKISKEDRKDNYTHATLTGVSVVESKIIASYHRNGYIVFWNLEDGSYKTKKIHNRNIVGVYFINRENYYTWSIDGTLKITKNNVTSLVEGFRPKLDTGVANAIQAKIKNNRIVIFSTDGVIRILNQANHKREFSLVAHSDYIYDVIVYNKMVISISRDNTIKLWNYKTQDLISSYIFPGVKKVSIVKGILIAYGSDGDIRILKLT